MTPPSEALAEAAAAGGIPESQVPWRRIGGGHGTQGRGMGARWRVARSRGKQASKAAARRERAEDIQAGLETSAWGWHVVRSILSVRRPTPRRGRQLDVLVEWAGADYFSQQPYAPAWVSITALRAELAAEARAMEEVRWPRLEQAVPEGSRKQPRRDARTGAGASA